jgi:hypothetical protein
MSNLTLLPTLFAVASRISSSVLLPEALLTALNPDAAGADCAALAAATEAAPEAEAPLGLDCPDPLGAAPALAAAAGLRLTDLSAASFFSSKRRSRSSFAPEAFGAGVDCGTLEACLSAFRPVLGVIKAVGLAGFSR